ncbi:hypothetical protein [Geodermatophilus sp. URMC 60]
MAKINGVEGLEATLGDLICQYIDVSRAGGVSRIIHGHGAAFLASGVAGVVMMRSGIVL